MMFKKKNAGKKFLSLALVFTLFLQMLTAVAFAAPGDPTLVVSAPVGSVAVGDTVDVTVSVMDNTDDVEDFSLRIAYAATDFGYSNFGVGALTAGGTLDVLDNLAGVTAIDYDGTIVGDGDLFTIQYTVSIATVIDDTTFALIGTFGAAYEVEFVGFPNYVVGDPVPSEDDFTYGDFTLDDIDLDQDGDDLVPGTWAWDVADPELIYPGVETNTYTAIFTPTDDATYPMTTEREITLTVSPKSIDVAIVPVSIVYGSGDQPVYTLDNFDDTQLVDPDTYEDLGIVFEPEEIDDTYDVGTYDVTCTWTNVNYTVVFDGDDLLEITKVAADPDSIETELEESVSAYEAYEVLLLQDDADLLAYVQSEYATYEADLLVVDGTYDLPVTWTADAGNVFDVKGAVYIFNGEVSGDVNVDLAGAPVAITLTLTVDPIIAPSLDDFEDDFILLDEENGGVLDVDALIAGGYLPVSGTTEIIIDGIDDPVPVHYTITWDVGGTINSSVEDDSETFTGTVVYTEAWLTEPVVDTISITLTVGAACVITVAPYEAVRGTVTGAGTYPAGKTVTLKATPNVADGYVFCGWYEDGVWLTDEFELNFTAEEDLELEAIFEYLYSVEYYNIEDQGSVGGGFYYVYGEGVYCVIEAYPNDGYTFAGWYDVEGDIEDEVFVLASENASYTFLLDSDRVLFAAYKSKLTVNYEDGGWATGGGTFSGCTTVTVKATAFSGYTFEGWYEDGEKVSSSATFSFVIYGNCTLTAKFTKNSTSSTTTTTTSGSSGGGGSITSGSIAPVTSDNGDGDGEGTTETPSLPKPTAVLDKSGQKGYISGYPDGSVRPNGNITRFEAASMFYNLVSNSNKAAYALEVNKFSDVEPGQWYSEAVGFLAAAGVISGYNDGTFKGGNTITRAEFVTIASKFETLDLSGELPFTDVPKDHWAYNYILNAYNKGWVSGYPDGTFGLDRPITRAEAFTITNKILGWTDAPTTFAIQPNDLFGGEWYYDEVMLAVNGK